MCTLPTLSWVLATADLWVGFLGVVGSILLAVPTFLGSGLQEEKLRLEEMQIRLKEPDLLQPLVLHALTRSIAFLHHEQMWMRGGALCLLAAFVVMSLQAACGA